jgi:hypothetical protein
MKKTGLLKLEMLAFTSWQANAENVKVDSIIYKDSVGVNDYKSAYSYDDYGRLTYSASYNWNSNSSAWETTYKEEITYGSNGNVSYARYTWDSTNSAWNGTKEELIYNNTGDLIRETFYTWNSITSEWENSSKWEFSYDSHGNRTLYITYIWNNGTSTWVGSNKSFVTLIQYMPEHGMPHNAGADPADY